FTGREAELARLTSLLVRLDQAPGTPQICAISGPAGVGKTALAVHWAHRSRDRFPDGQLYVNLRGYDPKEPPMSPEEAVRSFLDALLAPPARVPTRWPAQVGLYRSLLAEKRLLVVLDNARDAEQVRPLLPTTGGLALITSRDRMTGLVALAGATPLALDPLSPAESRHLLAHRLGAERVAAEPEAAQELVAACGGLPLALSILAARAAVRPHFPLATLAAELRDGDLEPWSGVDITSDLRTALSVSLLTLDGDAARRLCLLGLSQFIGERRRRGRPRRSLAGADPPPAAPAHRGQPAQRTAPGPLRPAGPAPPIRPRTGRVTRSAGGRRGRAGGTAPRCRPR